MTIQDIPTVWITGASSGIGRALVQVYFDAGYNVILSARRVQQLEEIKRGFPKAQRDRLQCLYMDLENPEGFDAACNEAWALFDGIDLLINNGGISQRSLVQETSMQVYRRIMEVNYFGNIALTKSLLPFFHARKKGHIAVVSSLVGKFGTPYRSGYAASKHALHGFYDSLRAETTDMNIGVTMICPGFIHTNVSVNALTGNGEALDQMDQAQAKGMKAEECARQIKRALDAGKFEVNIGGKETYGVLIKRFFPALFARKLPSIKVR